MTDCPECNKHIDEHAWAISTACASVGIEYGKSTYEMFKDYIRGYHRNHATKGRAK